MMIRVMFRWLLCVALCLTLLPTAVTAAPEAVDVKSVCTFSSAGTTYEMVDRSLTITATQAGAELALVLENELLMSDYPYWVGRIQSTVPFDIAFYDRANSNWIFAAGDFCYAFEQNNGASAPLPAGTHTAAIDLRTAYTFGGDPLPANAAVKSITFIAKAPGTITVPLCELRQNSDIAATPAVTYYKDGDLLKAIPTSHTAATLCDGVRQQFDATAVTVTRRNGNALAMTDRVGTGDVITLHNGGRTTALTAVVRGDLDGDGLSTTTDARCALQHFIGTAPLREDQLAAADLLTDLIFNTNDTRYMVKQSLQPDTIQLSQTSVVSEETFLSQAKYDRFLGAASRDALLAGLPEYLVPQGLAQSHSSGLTYVSAYSSNGGGSVIAVYDQAGRFCAEYHLFNANGSPCTAHLGGLAVTDTTLFASYDGDSTYRVAAIPLGSLVTTGTQKVLLNRLYEVPVATSFLSYYDGWLWMGNFYLPSAGYGLMRELNTTIDVNGEAYGCYIAGFDLSEQGTSRLQAENGNRYATPDVVLCAGQKVQGMAFDPAQNTVILSHSWGRHNDSKLAFYTVDPNQAASRTVTLNGTKVPCYVLASPTATVTTMPMTEGITLDGQGGVRILYESGADKYSDGTHRTDHIWRYSY